ncbi:tyrosine-type recombinase/integrase [Klebsiella aerogenes]|uniref:tyrosine-type recombinase/integrase n=1 Tax=Klebsiella aerogenes TaxID=548 RepID=UPI0021D01EC1|nr:integrase arm-type DNA-binding domain-containing protein [Klebsiella aerogenes]MCU6422058.1 integrase arm-type DNA-binding domain-containing protein [Klebsiella aerogenes]
MALTDIKVRTAKPTDKQYKLTDGSGMHLLVHPNGSKYWRLQYRYDGKQKMLALGVYPEITLADARARRDKARKLLANGVDPGDKKKNDKVEQSKARTFKEVAIEWHGTNKKWSEDHAHRVLKSLEDNLFAELGERNITELKTRDLLAPIKAVEMSGAVASGNRQHRPALELKRIPELLGKIDGYTGRPLTCWATELTLLIFIRSSELRFARWSEIDFKTSMWTIPPEREPILGVKHSHRGSKMRTPHLVPLSKQALAILKQIKQFCGEHELIFTGDHDPRKPMSENTVNSALRVMGYDTKAEVCGHGFRTMACSSLIESGLWSKDAVERQMSHMERNSVRAAYIHKAEHLDERKLMLQWWADFLDANREKGITPFDYAKINRGAGHRRNISKTGRYTI